MANTIKFNVGGEIFEVAQDIIRSSGDNFLSAMLDRWASDTSDPQFIDRDAHLFRFILAWLREKSILIPLTISTEAILNEARFFNLPITADDIQTDLSQLGTLRKRLVEIDDRLESSLQWKREKKLCVAMGQTLAHVSIAGMRGKSRLHIQDDDESLPEWVKMSPFGFDHPDVKKTLEKELNAAGYKIGANHFLEDTGFVVEIV